MELQQALQEFEKVMPEDGSFIAYETAFGTLMMSTNGRAAVKHIHDLRRAQLIQTDVVTNEHGQPALMIARKGEGE